MFDRDGDAEQYSVLGDVIRDPVATEAAGAVMDELTRWLRELMKPIANGPPIE